ncbi:MAG: hypothetical protein KDB80_16870 [Planctomycetes bacterium]|nr:hypothetical protein [Planctomycetota bacterium]
MSFLHEIERLANHARVAMESTRDAIEFAVHRDGVDVRIRVAPDVLEWSVEAVDQATGAQASERWDYTGYDDCTRSELEASLLEDLSEFMHGVAEKRLRFPDGEPRLEWETDGVWSQAVPFYFPM